MLWKNMQNYFSGSGTTLGNFPDHVWGVRSFSVTVFFDTVTIRDRAKRVACVP